MDERKDDLIICDELVKEANLNRKQRRAKVAIERSKKGLINNPVTTNLFKVGGL